MKGRTGPQNSRREGRSDPAVSADALGYPLERVLRMNLDKLRARYPDGFDPGRSRERPREDV